MYKRVIIAMVVVVFGYTLVEGGVSWWNSAYKYRQRLTVTAGSSVLSAYVVKLTVDTATLESAGKIQREISGERKDLRIAYWDGTKNVELNRYYTNSTDIWFGLQINIGAGASDTNYYLYYGNSNETTTPSNNLTNLFTSETGVFTRPDATAGAATYIDSSTGKITEVNANIPRYGSSKFDQGVISEGSRVAVASEYVRTNSLIQSSFETDSAGSPPTGWTVGSGSPTVQTDYAKHGTKSLRISASAGRTYVTQAQGALNSGRYCASVWVYIESWTSGLIELQLQDVTNTASFYATADTSKVGQWQRISVKNNTNSTSITTWLDVGRTTATAVVYYDAVQLEEWGASGTADGTATSYIPTTSSSISRARDRLNFNRPANMTGSKGTFSCWLVPFWSARPPDYADIINSSSNPSIYSYISVWSETTSIVSILVGVRQINYTVPISPWLKLVPAHLCLTWDEVSNSLKIYVNGSDIAPDTETQGTFIITGTTITIGNISGGNEAFNGIISDIGIYDSALTSAEVSALYQAQNSGTRRLVLPMENLASSARLIFTATLGGSLQAYTRSTVSIDPQISKKGNEEYSFYNVPIPANSEKEISALDDPLTKIKILANTIDKDVLALITKVDNPEAAKIGSKDTYIVYDITISEFDTGKEIKTFNNPLTITLHIKTNQLKKDVTTDNLSLAFWNGTYWVPLNSRTIVSGEDILVTADTNHLSQFAIISREGKKSLTVYPNPFTPASSQFNKVIFSFENGENSEVELKIWDVTGVLVRAITQSGGTTIEWDGRNEYGDVVEGGVYIYQLTIGGSPPTRYRGTVVVAK